MSGPETASSEPPATPAAANVAFINEHLAHRWLEIREVPTWKGHRERVRAAARARGLSAAGGKSETLFFDDDRCVGALVGMMPSSVGVFARSICASKARTRKLLSASFLPVPEGLVLSARSDQQKAEAHLLSHAQVRFVLKPVDGRGGRGITTGIITAQDLERAWGRAQRASTKKRLVLEEEVPGVDIRIFVVDGVAVSAAARVPPFVVGDGGASLQQLQEQLTEARRRNAYLRGKPPVVDTRVLQEQGKTAETVPAAGEVVLLNGTANVSMGGVNVEVSSSIAPEALRLAEGAVSAVPGLHIAGVDLLMPSPNEAAAARVIELNTSPNLSLHEYPAYGEPRDVASKIVEGILRSHRSHEPVAGT